MRRRQNLIKITQDHIDALKAAKLNSGCGAARFLRWVNDAPSGLQSTTIYNWMERKAVQANKEQLEFTLEHWPKMPARMALERETIEHLQSEMKRTGLTAARIFRLIECVPEGLNLDIVQRILSGKVDTVRKDHIDAVLSAYASVPNN